MKKGRIHCIGIGGIGLSALAQYFKHEGYEVSGTDQSDSKITTLLTSKGISVAIGHHPELITSDIERVFYTAALPDTDPELIRAQELHIPTHTYAQGLGMISKNKKTIAVAGSHGKTSTTAMIAHILREGKKDPTVIVGSLLGKDGTNFLSGKNELFVVESCEYKKSFLEIDPWIAVVTNIDNDHLDYYGTIENLVATFKTFVEKYLVYQAPEKYSKISVKYDNQIVTTLNSGYKPEEDSLQTNEQNLINTVTGTQKPEEKTIN